MIVALSALGHLALFALVGLQVPQLRQMILPPQQTMELDLVERPRTAPPTSAAKPVPVQPRPTPAPPRGVATLPLPPAPAAPRGGASIGSGYAAVPAPPGPDLDLKKALRGFTPGCRDRDAVGLTRREREACDERLGRGSQTATFIPAPMDPAKRAGYDAQAAKDEAYRRYKQGNMPPGVTPGNDPGKNTGLGDDYAGVRR
ncbi:hypothetical protein QO010_002611 [Caulobacter ginsengisoli]|uniref:Energy transducer TonB n=1 Tax=Caulobacter ginsengisoli TaxID=400775 RepID=A0ABU0IS36_9CAUL|nr:hypothetical protein [Caulobacter ginsengisoli]MDQ0464827.1 hypothetical protein [Caulobacter ginsengisoli]